MNFNNITASQVRIGLQKPNKWYEDRAWNVSASLIRYILGSVSEQQKAYRSITNTQTQDEKQELDNLPRVKMGTFTEGLNLVFFEDVFETKTERVGPFKHPDFPHYTASPDAICSKDGDKTIVECKHTHSNNSVDYIYETYYSQVQWQMYVTGIHKSIISVIYGNDYVKDKSIIPVDYDSEYINKILPIISEWYENHCINEIEIFEEKPSIIINYDDRVSYNFETNNEWVNEAIPFLTSKIDHDIHCKSKKSLKLLIPDDAKIVTGAGIKASVSKTGRVTIRSFNDE